MENHTFVQLALYGAQVMVNAKKSSSVKKQVAFGMLPSLEVFCRSFESLLQVSVASACQTCAGMIMACPASQTCMWGQSTFGKNDSRLVYYLWAVLGQF